MSIINASDYSSALELIKGTRYGGLITNDHIDEALRLEKKNLLDYIKRDTPDEKIYTFFALSIDYDNFEAVAKARRIGYSEKPFCEEEGRYKIDDIVRSFREDAKIIDNPYINEMLSIYKKESSDMTPKDINYLFVSYKYKELKSIFGKGIMREIVDYLLDCENISIALRVKNKQDLKKNLIEYGTLRIDILERLDQDILQDISSPYLREIISTMRDKKDRLILEKIRARHVLSMIAENKTSDLNVFLDYIFRKLNEIKNLNMIFSLFENGLTDKIKKMLIV